MTAEPRVVRHDHGRPLRVAERARLAGIARSLQVDGPAAYLQWPVEFDEQVPVQWRRRLMARSGWPAWMAFAGGALLIFWGLQANSGWPLLIGACLALTSPTWLLLAPLRPVVRG